MDLRRAAVAVFCGICILGTAGALTPRQSIDSSQALAYAGSVRMVCDTVTQVTTTRHSFYLNMGGSYPMEKLGVRVLRKDAYPFQQRHGSLLQLQGKRVCAYGFIRNDRGHLHMPLTNPDDLRVAR